ncbi:MULTISPECIES: single-stranded-DNA-specific exonuclease RecJ [Limnospira]|uniref:single-stranded-DNA-specific exonuclease RecJ n=1 Tax=Limnospira TaxID=2596745 RepID=UPI0001D0ED9E|nr:single-stranded-DNA-specific exonuclease RecJ [Arthrospira platensis NCB002]MDT9184043.1 single-stranded-DNA-specific exonuclease RecJ [Limnospira sp. PMC 289.06]BAI89091.1 single-stranded-DNA-specific exonuclease [Arthrospira platensis NIES-39]BDT11493.1 single-stranded-DNA-specific exonuclease [Arthrospira platensis NIES-39]
MEDQPTITTEALLPKQRWHIFPERPEIAQSLSETTGVHPIIAQILINRGIETTEQAEAFLNPQSQTLPEPMEEFPDLPKTLQLLQNAIENQQKIAICGDYDADGMTSTALLIRALSQLGADITSAIPSRMQEGYGINNRIVEEFHEQGISIIITVDNGISAVGPVARAKELGLTVIITDHHDLPPKLPNADAILNPKLLPKISPYYGLAGVGVAYILALSLAKLRGEVDSLRWQLLELFTLGTIADMAPLNGVNRRWIKRGLKILPQSKIPGVQALIQIAGLANQQPNLNNSTTPMKPEDIGFRLGPRINAIGRIGNPQVVIELLTTDHMGTALEQAKECEETNLLRKELCADIEQEAIDWYENSNINLEQERVLVPCQKNWHHGVIGIVASRLVERYGVPVFICTYEDEENLRGSARGIPEFHVFEALQFCQDILGKFGGHKAAGGFSLPAANLPKFKQRLSEFAHQCLQVEHLRPLVNVDVRINLMDINYKLYDQIDKIQPCGIENSEPVFWTPKLRVLHQKIVGKSHIKLTLSQDLPPEITMAVLPTISAIAWRWADYFPLPSPLDFAYKLRKNTWNNQTAIELEIVGVRLPENPVPLNRRLAEFNYCDRTYKCNITPIGDNWELRIRNQKGEVLAIQTGQKTGLLGISRSQAKTVDISHPFFMKLIEAAQAALDVKLPFFNN